MEHVIIGTAGHIDHGKTALIRALTGRETDTQKEEKKRGITIDLGFTYFDLPGGMKAGIIDVPGHEKFLPNMLAGVCGMDIILLTIALDEGIMPQTREHMDILEQLGITNGVIVLTKLDMVEEEWADMMEEEIAQQLAGRVFASWPRIKVSAHEGTGIEELKKLICDKAAVAKHQRETTGHFRLPIDRLFTVKGLGTVVAGTVLEGTVGTDQEVMIYPIEETTKVKSLQTHGEGIEEAYAGQRAAILLQGISKEQVSRGMVLAYPDSMRTTNRLDVAISLSKDCNRVVKNQSRVHLHIGTKEVLARVVLLDKPELKASEEGFAQLITEEPISVKRNDRFIIRFLSPLETLGGGKVLQIEAPKHKRFDDGLISELQQRKDGRQEQLIISVIDGALKQPISLEELRKQAQMDEEELIMEKKRLETEEKCLILKGRKQDYYWSFQAFDEKWLEIKHVFEKFHKEHPYRRGMGKAFFKSSLFKGWETGCFDIFLGYLISSNRLSGENEFLWLSSFEIRMDDRYEKVRKLVLEEARKASYSLVDYSKIDITVDGDTEDIIEALCVSGELVRIHDTLCTTKEIAIDIQNKVKKYFETEEILSFASLRDLLEISRKAAKPLMEYLDNCKITLWCGKETERKQNKIN